MNTRKILITYALPKEGKVAKSFFANYKSSHRFEFLELGMWTHNTLLTLTQKLSETKYDFVVNYGVCWYTEEKEACIQIARSVYSPSEKELTIPLFFKFAPLASCLCSDRPVYDPNTLWDLKYVDMESYGVEKVCEHFRIPRIILKVPIDKLWEQTQNFDREAACKTMEENLNFHVLTQGIKKYLDSLQESPELEKYKDFFWFTVSENIIFEKYYHAYSSLSERDFDVFYTTNKNLTKVKFLEFLREEINSLRNLIW